MATDSTLQKIADNLLAQFDKTLLDNSTDFSSCDQILNAAPSEHKGGLESLYCDLLLDALISGYYRYSEMDTKQLVDDPLYTKFKKMVYGLDRSDPYNLLYYAIIDLVSGKKENVLQYLSAYLDEKIKSLKTESGIFTAEDFTYILVVPLKEGFPGMWSAIGRMLDRDDVEAGIPEMCAALDHLYNDSKNESIIESLTQVLQCNPKILLAKELLGYTYYNMQMLGNALSYFEQFEDGKPTSRIFLEGTVYFWMAWCYGKKKDCLKEEEYYRKSLEALPVGENLLEDELVQRMEIGIPVFGMPLRIYQKRGVYGRQFVLRNGRLDILGIDTAGDLYVIELKKDSGYDDAYAQTREYIDWIEEDVAVKGQRVFGIICLNDPTKDLIEKVKADDQMRLFEYSISYSEII